MRDQPITFISENPTTCESNDVIRDIVIIGSGPTGLGAALRLKELRHVFQNVHITILEKEDHSGGLSSSERDEKGFLWDIGGHVVFSHYEYFDNVLDIAVKEWNQRVRAAYAFMMGSDGVRRFIAYPVQNNIADMDDIDQSKCLHGLEQIGRNLSKITPSNFDEWLVQRFGEGLSDVFMRKYNRKIWTVETKSMNYIWVGDRVSVPDVETIKFKILQMKRGIHETDSTWGPNRYFRYPKYNGTMAIWEGVANLIPQHWFQFNSKVVKIEANSKRIFVERTNGQNTCMVYSYDYLITTAPLDLLVDMVEDRFDQSLNRMKESVSRLIYSHTNVVGLGLSGQPPEALQDKSWIYFPDSDSPFYRITVFSNYSKDHVPDPLVHWSLMCESAEPMQHINKGKWSRNALIQATIDALVLYGFIIPDMIVSKYHRRLEHGYPVPSLGREQVLKLVQPWLESKGILSRGRFGGWRYEVGNQDHSLMQGVEVVDKILRGIPEETYPNANFVNSRQQEERFLYGM